MTLKQLDSQLTILEGKKVSVTIGQVREIRKKLQVLEASYRVKLALEQNTHVDNVLNGDVFAVLEKGVLPLARKAYKKAKAQQKKAASLSTKTVLKKKK